MKYIDFINVFREPIFTIQDLKISNISVSTVQLSQWTKNGYLIKLKNGVYAFNERKESLNMELISRFLFEPSYVSLERALSRYGLIPELVYNCTSVTSKKTTTIKNFFGVFIFRNLKKELFFGYDKINDNGRVYFLAEPEKALLDYLYLNSAKINNEDDVEELRLNDASLKELDSQKIREYLKIFNSRKLEKILTLIYKNDVNLF